MTEGDPKTILTSMEESEEDDGYKALVVFQSRFDNRTPANMLQAYFVVVKPTVVKVAQEVVPGVLSLIHI